MKYNEFIISRGEIRASLPSLFQIDNPELMFEPDDGDEDYEEDLYLCKMCGNLFNINNIFTIVDSDEFICINCIDDSGYKFKSG